MLRDHLRSFWRGVVNNKLTTGINVGGLALGLAVFFALTFHVQREFSYDAQWEGADRVYVIAGRQESSNGNGPPFIFLSFHAVGTTLQSRHPGVFEVYARVRRAQGRVEIAQESFPNRMVHYAEPALLELLQFETAEGSLQQVFSDPRAIAISSKAATAMFGQQSALGQTLTFNSDQGNPGDYTVKAVYRVPEPSSLSEMDFIALFDPTAPAFANVNLDSWESPVVFDNYARLRPGISTSELEADLRGFMDENHYLESGDGQTKTRFVFVPLQDVHLMPSGFNPQGGADGLRILAGIGALVLLISGCNFVMLATLRSVDCMREVGIRKTVGGEAGQLMRQYLLDVFLQTLIAALLAIVLLELALPWLQARLDMALRLELLSWRSLSQCLGIVIVFTLLSGIYPAVLMSRGQPAALLRNSGGAVVSNGNPLRRLLVGIQFAVVIGLLLASAVVRQQIEYTLTRDRGYSLENVMAMRLNSTNTSAYRELIAKTPELVNEFKRVPGVAEAAVGSISPGVIITSTPTRVTVDVGDGNSVEAALQAVNVGAGYFNLMSVPLLAGREFSSDVEGAMPAAESDEEPREMVDVVLNAAAVRMLGFATPEAAINALLAAEFDDSDETRRQSMRVIGVVADTQFSSMMLPPVAQLYRFSDRNGFIAVRFEPDVAQATVADALHTVWQGLMGDVSFVPLAPELMEGPGLFREELEARIVIGSAMLALVVALMGLYGLVESTVAKRVKEIGVRKVMGADVPAIVSLLIWQFSKPIVIANLVAWPLGFWGISRWLQRFPYQLDTGVIVLSAVMASIVALLIAWFTIGVMATRAARAKPVSALRYE